jgi:hypothetical protein
MQAMEHIEALSKDIGPRGSTTAKEREAAQYAERSLRQFGFEPIVESFRSARSGWKPYVAFSLLIIVSIVLFSSGGVLGAVLAFLLTFLTLGSVILELLFRPNLIRAILPKGDSQNVWAVSPPRNQPRHKVVLIGHLDSHRTPLVFSSNFWLKFFNVLVPVGLASSLVLLAIFVLGIFNDSQALRTLSIPFLVLAFGLLVITAQADLTSFTHGSNDNASGAGVVLRLAERLKSQPLSETAVWVLLSGCEEVGCYGAQAFAKSHRAELENAVWITVDTVGGRGADPCYLTQETFLLTTHSDQQLVELAGNVAAEHPELGARAHQFKSAYTEGAIGGMYGFRVLSMVNVTSEGILPEWHQVTDIIENVDPELVGKTEIFLWELLAALDHS